MTSADQDLKENIINELDQEERAGDAPLPEEELQRAETYMLLSRLLHKAPDAKILEALCSVEGDDSELGQAMAALTQAARATSLEKLHSEFDNLFLAMPAAQLTPYGSFYIAGKLYSRPLAELRMSLARLGIARHEKATEPEDHIATLFEVMAGLILGAFSPGPVSLCEQRSFFKDHIESWAGKFFDDLQASPDAVFYMPLGALGKRFIQIESEAFAMIGPPVN